MPEQAQTREAEEQRAREEANLPLSPPKPYRVDTTGLSTSNLPKPPLFRGRPGQEQQLETQPPSLPLIARAAPPTPPQRPAHTKQQQQQQRSPTAKPSLPPRLPLRQNPNPEQNAPPAPPTYKDATKQQQAPPRNPGSINRCVLDRLEAAGVNVPGLGIGAHKDDHSASSGPPARFADGPTSPQAPAWSQPQSVPAMTRGPELSELQSRFSRMSSSTAASLSPSNPSNSTGPSTSQLAGQGARMFNHWNQQQQQQQQQTTGIVNTRTGDTVDVAGSAQRTATTKKLPPPAPPKKKTLLDVQRGAGDGDGGGPSTPPPPIPLGSKPRTG